MLQNALKIPVQYFISRKLCGKMRQHKHEVTTGACKILGQFCNSVLGFWVKKERKREIGRELYYYFQLCIVQNVKFSRRLHSTEYYGMTWDW